MTGMAETNKAILNIFPVLQSNISVRCTSPGFRSTFCYKYFEALPLFATVWQKQISYMLRMKKKVQRTGYICSLDNVLNTEGAAHRNIIMMAKSAFQKS
jgi:hypothetical protein